MNQEQVKSTIRSVLTAVGGFALALGWAKAQNIIDMLQNEAVLGFVASLAAMGWGLFRHKQSNQVAATVAIAAQPDSPVKGIITENTPEGRQLALSIDGPVAASGTANAADIAKTTRVKE